VAQGKYATIAPQLASATADYYEEVLGMIKDKKTPLGQMLNKVNCV